MPTLPDPSQTQRRIGSAITGTASYTPYQATPAEPLVRGLQAQTRAPLAAARFGEEVNAMAEKELDRIDALRADEAAIELGRRTIDLTTGDNGYLKDKGGTVVEQGWRTGRLEAYDTAASGIASRLTPSQKRKFQEIAGRGRLNYEAGITQHAMKETDVYEADIDKAKVQGLAESIRALPTDPNVLADGVAARTTQVLDRLDKTGIKDPELRGQALKEQVGVLYAVAVEGALDAGYTEYARTLLKNSKEHMSAAHVKELEKRIKPALDLDIGDAAGLAAYQLEKSGGKPVDVNALLVKQTEGNPQARNFAEARLRSLRIDEKVALDNQSGTVMRAFLMERKSINDIVRMPEFKALDAGGQAKVYQDIETLSYTRRMRSEAEKNAHEGRVFNNPQTHAKYLEIRSQILSGDMSTEQILAKASTVGDTYVKQLLNVQAEAQDAKQKGVATFKINPDLVNSAYPGDVKSKEKKDREAWEGAVYSEVDRFKRDNGRAPDQKEQTKILRDLREIYFKPGMLWGTSKQAYQVIGSPEAAQEFVPKAYYETRKKEGIPDAQIQTEYVLNRNNVPLRFYADFKAERARKGKAEPTLQETLDHWVKNQEYVKQRTSR